MFAAFHDLADRAYFANTLLVCAANNVPGPVLPVAVRGGRVGGGPRRRRSGRVVLQPARRSSSGRTASTSTSPGATADGSGRPATRSPHRTWPVRPPDCGRAIRAPLRSRSRRSWPRRPTTRRPRRTRTARRVPGGLGAFGVTRVQRRRCPSTSSSSSTGIGDLAAVAGAARRAEGRRGGQSAGRDPRRPCRRSGVRPALLRLDEALLGKPHLVLVHRVRPLRRVIGAVAPIGGLYRVRRRPRKTARRRRPLSAARHADARPAAGVGLRQRLHRRSWRPQVAQRLLVHAGQARQVGGLRPHAAGTSAWRRRGAGTPGRPSWPAARPPGSSRSVVSVSATTSAVRGLPVSAAISPKKSPARIVERPR